ncbi:MAG TPA: hypothetical protein VKE74_01460 [Gemmataceae bacterium]|nr:hypothetical protein [Gemmataceae bacterium]
MTEAQWLACEDPQPMLEFLRGAASGRKLRHFLVACARNVLPAAADADMVAALAAAERFADGAATRGELARARAALKTRHPARVKKWPRLYSDHIRSVPAWHATREQLVRAAVEGAGCCAWSSTRRMFAGTLTMTYPDRELARQAHLLRDTFGNPFRPVTLGPTWLTSTVVTLAEGIYTERAFDRLPILADALQDAGCEDPEILAHCRGPGPHVRGCWVVDLVLRKR